MASWSNELLRYFAYFHRGRSERRISVKIGLSVCLFLLASNLLAASRSLWQVPGPSAWTFEKSSSSPGGPAFAASVPGYRFRAYRGGFAFTSPAESLRWSWVGGDRRAEPEGVTPAGAGANYFFGNRHKNWRTGIHRFERIRYRNVWPGIDIVLYGSGLQFEYDFVIAPGADPGIIRIKAEGISGVRTGSDQSIVFQTPQGVFSQAKAVLYQEVGGNRIPVQANYVLTREGYIKLNVAGYDHTKSLVVDPVITYSTQIGGNGAESTAGIARDRFGNVYLAGTTTSTDLAAQGVGQRSNGSADAFVTKLDPQGKVVYSTYLGGAGEDHATGIAVDEQGNVYLAGWTTSLNFPTLNSPCQNPDFRRERNVSGCQQRLPERSGVNGGVS